MKAISIKEPWASMIANGQKTIETRVWKTSYRGKLLICASAAPHSILAGNAIATANLVDCKPMTIMDVGRACCNVYPNAQSWFLENVKTIAPFKVKGKLRLFDVNYTE